MNTPEFESTKRILTSEIETATYNVDSLYENNYFRRKIENYLIESIICESQQSECLDWIVKVLEQKGFDEKIISDVRANAELQFCILEKFKNRKS